MKNTMAALGMMALLGCAHMDAAGSGGQASAKATVSAGDYYPLVVGTLWTYEASMLGEKQGISVEILKKEGDFAVDSTGAQLMVDTYGVRDQKRYLLRNPIEVGTRWTNVVSVSSVESYEITSVDDACETPAGAFKNCVMVKSSNRVKEGETLINDMTFAPHVGIVRIATALDSRGKLIPQSQLQLTRFVAAPAAIDTTNSPK